MVDGRGSWVVAAAGDSDVDVLEIRDFWSDVDNSFRRPRRDYRSFVVKTVRPRFNREPRIVGARRGGI